MRPIRIALAQINATVGDITGNTRLIQERLEQARALRVDLVVFPELAITGYPPEDLLLMPRFIRQNLKALDEIVKAAHGLTCVVGFVDQKDDRYNAAAVIHDGKLIGSYHKVFLPNYSVFDEDRYFQKGKTVVVFELQGIKVGVSICEDIWHAGDPIKTETVFGDAEVVLNISASPFHAGKREARLQMLASQARDNAACIAYVNLVGGQDELVFDGNSMFIAPDGGIIAQAHSFAEDLLVVDLDADMALRARLHEPRRRKEKQDYPADHLPLHSLRLPETKKIVAPKPPLARHEPMLYDAVAEVYQALTVGTHDYCRKNGFERVYLGVSGGIDSAVVAAIAADALGKENVTGIAMPSPFSSAESLEDARQLAQTLGIKHLEIPIAPLMRAYLDTLNPLFQGRPADIAEENIQARIRGNILMALANKFNALVLATGNKSELSTGYCTLYGDMAGGFAVIRDCPKTLVYHLAEYKNKCAGKEVIPVRIIQKEPAAELRPHQKDSDTLPPYPLLDPILQAYVEEDKGADEIVAMGFAPEMVKEVIERVDRNEYKRRQGPPGIKITPRALGKDRRLPITNRYRNYEQRGDAQP